MAEVRESNVASTVAGRLIGAPMEAGDVATLLLEICSALKAIHEAGDAHADLAPRNIRLVEHRAVEIDCFAAPPSGATLMVTEPKYASPELLLGQSTLGGTVHLQSDIYVLGFVAYEALAGTEELRKQLLQGSGETENDLFWMKWHSDTGRQLRVLNELNPSIPVELAMTIERMTAKDPGARFSKLEEVEEAIRQFQRRLEATDDVELASLFGAGSESSGKQAIPATKRFGWKSWLSMSAVLTTIALAWMSLGYLRTFVRSAMVTTERAGQAIAGQPATSKAPPSLPSAVETPSGPMVLVTVGSFVMGSSVIENEGPARTVYLPAYYIDKYEVSNDRYRAFTDATGYARPTAPSWDVDYFAKDSYPALNVSWRDAQAFCVAAGKRLPSEAEWEKAARGASPGSRTWANWTVPGLANLKRTGMPSAPAPMGSFPLDISPFGAYDMAGNVHEWVNDQYTLYSGNPVSLENTGTTKVVRGGSFALSPQELSPSWRASQEALIGAGEDSPVGFRCAADPHSVADPSGKAINHRRVQSPR